MYPTARASAAATSVIVTNSHRAIASQDVTGMCTEDMLLGSLRALPLAINDRSAG